MVQLWLVASLVVIGAGEAADPPKADPDKCTCPKAKIHNGWCARCKVGYAASVKVPSALLFEAIDAHGHDFDVASLRCSTCRAASSSSGFCSTCRMGFVNGQAYLSRLTYLLAKGKAKDPVTHNCATCRGNSGRFGWCRQCQRGMVGHFAYADRTVFEEAVREVRRLQSAIAKLKDCELCAIAMITDARCPKCNIHYKEGKRVPPDPSAKPARGRG
ncbi:MAG: hypothetical protein IIC01_09740, partial [Planctomycetes bacterium]|nr:hypothetical protein [Planctomycetota bacterium]